MTKFWDGNESLDFQIDDGGRAAAGFKGRAGDCVARSVSIAAGLPYAEVYATLSRGMGSQRMSRGATARNGISTSRKWFKDHMASLGFVWTPTMHVGQGCKVHLLKGELPQGRIIAALSKHYVSIIDGVIHDTSDPQRQNIVTEDGVQRIAHRCVYGYWAFQQTPALPGGM